MSKKYQGKILNKSAYINDTNTVIDILSAIKNKSNSNNNDIYRCMECKDELIIKNGDILQAHFCHKNIKDCINNKNYDPHKNAQKHLKEMLETKIIKIQNMMNNNSEIKFDLNQHNVEIEFKFTYNNSFKSADIAMINKTDNKLVYIFEIYSTHKTNNNDRPEPWYEIRGSEVCNKYTGKLHCIRNRKCKD